MLPDATARGEVEGRSRPAPVEAGGARAARGGEKVQIRKRQSDSVSRSRQVDLPEMGV